MAESDVNESAIVNDDDEFTGVITQDEIVRKILSKVTP
jgi:hypothetical protein